MARIYDIKREKDIDVHPMQAEAMAKYHPERYVLPSDIEDIEEGFDVYVPKKDDPDEIKERVDSINKTISILDEIDNSSVDATSGAKELADESGIDLDKLYQGERINKRDVQNHIDGQD